MKNGKVFKIIIPLDTCIPDQHDFILRKEIDTTNWVLYPGGGGAMSYTTFGSCTR